MWSHDDDPTAIPRLLHVTRRTLPNFLRPLRRSDSGRADTKSLVSGCRRRSETRFGVGQSARSGRRLGLPTRMGLVDVRFLCVGNEPAHAGALQGTWPGGKRAVPASGRGQQCRGSLCGPLRPHPEPLPRVRGHRDFDRPDHGAERSGCLRRLAPVRRARRSRRTAVAPVVWRLAATYAERCGASWACSPGLRGVGGFGARLDARRGDLHHSHPKGCSRPSAPGGAMTYMVVWLSLDRPSAVCRKWLSAKRSRRTACLAVRAAPRMVPATMKAAARVRSTVRRSHPVLIGVRLRAP